MLAAGIVASNAVAVVDLKIIQTQKLKVFSFVFYF